MWKGRAEKLAPIAVLTSKKAKWKWTEVEQQVFEAVDATCLGNEGGEPRVERYLASGMGGWATRGINSGRSLYLGRDNPAPDRAQPPHPTRRADPPTESTHEAPSNEGQGKARDPDTENGPPSWLPSRRCQTHTTNIVVDSQVPERA